MSRNVFMAESREVKHLVRSSGWCSPAARGVAVLVSTAKVTLRAVRKARSRSQWVRGDIIGCTCASASGCTHLVRMAAVGHGTNASIKLVVHTVQSSFENDGNIGVADVDVTH
jgi:hypothetical protein